MAKNGLSGWMIRSIRWIGVAIMVLGVAGLVFGIVSLVAANTARNDEIAQLKLEQAPTTVDELKAARETLRDARYRFDPPPLNSVLTETNPLSPNATTQLAHNVLIEEKGIAIALTTLGWARVTGYVGIGTIILSVGLIVAGFLAFGLGPGISQIRTAMAQISKPPQSPAEG